MSVFHQDELGRDVPLAPKTTIGIGGLARYFYRAHSQTALLGALRWAQSQALPVFVLGGGSNVLFPDKGFPGLVVCLEISGIVRRASETRVHVGAGEDWDDLVAWCVANQLAGIECLSGIPGKVGAAPIQNIGAYGQELANVLRFVDVLDMQNLQMERMAASSCRLGYRSSIFKHGPDANRYAVVGIELSLLADGPPFLRYPELQQKLSATADLAQARAAVLALRASKSMVLNAHDPNARSCGSFFTNPLLTTDAYQTFLGHDVGAHPHYPDGSGSVKLSAAWLIEKAGFCKGYIRGKVGLSEKHCLAVINRGGGTAADILALASELQAGVFKRFGVTLQPEPVIVDV